MDTFGDDTSTPEDVDPDTSVPDTTLADTESDTALADTESDTMPDTVADTTPPDTSADTTPADTSPADTVCTPVCGPTSCGDDGCGGNCGLCWGTDRCIDGECVQPPPPATCREIYDCVAAECQSSCQTHPNGTACHRCKTDCRAPGNEQSRGLHDAVGACFECTSDTCLNGCVDYVGTCLFPGLWELTCLGIFDCGSQCGGVESCVESCASAGRRDAQGAWVILTSCLARTCSSTDTACRQQAVASGGACHLYQVVCQQN